MMTSNAPNSDTAGGGGRTPRVAVTDYTFDTLDIESAILEPLGCRVDGRRCKTAAEVADLTRDADYVITQFAPVNAEVIGAMTRARVISRYGIGVDNVDLDAARAKGIPVCNVPDYCISEVADHTLALALGATRRLVQNWDKVRTGGWGLAVPVAEMKALDQMTVGVIGFGRIGRQVVERFKPFGCRVQVFDPAVPPDQVRAAGAEPATLDEVWKSADLVTLHCPSNAHTRRMINADSLGRMKPGVIFINVGRGDLVDPPALLEALRSGRVGFAGLDVWDPEPIQADSPLRQMSNVAVTSHIASVSPKAVRTLRESAAEAVARIVRGEPAANVVNGVTTVRPVGA